MRHDANPQMVRYRRALVLAALTAATEPRTAFELLEPVLALALDGGAEPADLRDYNVPMVAGVLRSLVSMRVVQETSRVLDNSKGRSVPMFAPVTRPTKPPPPPTFPRLGPHIAQVREIQQDAKRASRNGTAIDPTTSKVAALFRNFAEDSAGLLLKHHVMLGKMQADIAALVERHKDAYNAAVEEAT